jgi:hypothetical protein
MKPTVSEDFPPIPPTDELETAVKTVLMAMFNLWSLTPDEEAGKVTRTQAAERLGIPESHPVLEVLGLFDHWSNDIMCMGPYFGVAYKAPKWNMDLPPPYIEEAAQLFVPPPKPEGDRWYWSLDEAQWVEQGNRS